jgi:3-dehydroquinate dehydratase/shikimate dehydrogenase
VAHTTDPAGVLRPLRARGIAVASRPVAVIGCGGAGRAIAAALVESGAAVSLVNRGVERGLGVAARFGVPFIPLSEFNPEGFAVVVNATPVGREPGEVPFAIERLSPGATVVDLVYGPRPTQLVCRARGPARAVIDGREVFLVQGRRQFRLMTGRPLGVRSARQSLGWPVEDGGSPTHRAPGPSLRE